ncbi:hypothetical protein [Thermococcus sp. 4557]|uniref:hypothetical protein n=1 Tax=Thermococcus sp. (strain CGMCC 1.5172 / 4557) TaxID=1042877 RepID=UPI0011D1AD46|nr:hypothetical protein [Thermococcus sp. 4557]
MNMKARVFLVGVILSLLSTISHIVNVLSIKSHGVNRTRSHKMGLPRHAPAKFAIVIQYGMNVVFSKNFSQVVDRNNIPKARLQNITRCSNIGCL